MKNKLILFYIFLLAISFYCFGCSTNNNKSSDNVTQNESNDEETTRVFSHQNEASMLYWRGIAEETGYDPVKMIIDTHETTVKRKGETFNYTTYDVEIDMKYYYGVVYMTYTIEEYNKIQEWQKRTGIQVIYPYVFIDEIPGVKDNANFWYKCDSKGKAVLDSEENLIPVYSSDADKSGAPYNSLRIQSDDGTLIYSIPDEMGVKCRVCYYAYNYLYKNNA